MPWNDTSPMNLRTQFIADFLRHSQSITELCRYCPSKVFHTLREYRCRFFGQNRGRRSILQTAV